MITWTWADFNQLGGANLYKVLALRQSIFIEEQNYAYNDCDERDQDAQHLLALDSSKDQSNPQLVAYARLMLPQYNEGKLEVGRVVVHKDYRNQGLGRALLTKVIARIDEDHPRQSAYLSVADDKYGKTLPDFYGKFGFAMVKGDTVNHSKYYQYVNFNCVLHELVRPPKVQALPQKNQKKDSSSQSRHGFFHQNPYNLRRKNASEKERDKKAVDLHSHRRKRHG